MNNARNARFKVVPGLSISNKELLERVRNRSIVVDSSSNQYSNERLISEANRKSRVEIARDMLIDGGKLHKLGKTIAKDVMDYKMEQAKEAGRKEAIASKGGVENGK